LTSTITVSESLQVYANPYRGLKPFTAEDADSFFGRDALIAEMLAQLRQTPRFLAVVGPSGSGKSSVVQAGLLPALRRGALTGSQDWQIVTLRPSADPHAVIDLSGFSKPDRSEHTILFLDQFEELFALYAPKVQQRFLADLHALITGVAPLTVILALRADFYGHLQRSPLGAGLKQALVDVLPLTPEELRAAVEEPAQRVGLTFEVGLIESIVQDAGQAEHTLPLLQSALAQVCHQQEDRWLTYTVYQSVGGVAGALSLWAEDAYVALSAEEQTLARRIFTRLVHFNVGEGTDTRQRQSLIVLAARPEDREAVHRLVRRLADARLLLTAEHMGGQTVEIIHDALLHEWGRLAGWITEKREFYLWRQRLDTQLQSWETKARDDGDLLRGKLLAEAESWATSHNDDLNTLERSFIKASLNLREQERAAAERRRRRRLMLVIIGVAVVFLVLALLAWGQRNVALDAQATAEAEAQCRATAQAEAEAQRIEAVNAQATAEVWRIEVEEANATAEIERERAEQQAQIALARQLAAQAQTVWDQRNQSLMHVPRVVLLAVESLRRSPESAANQLLTAGLSWLPREVARMAHEKPVPVVAFSPDGRWVVSGSWDNTVRVWEAATGAEVARMTHEVRVYAVAFSPDGRWVVSGGCDQSPVFTCIRGSARVWEAATGAEVARMMHEGYVDAVAFSPDGRWVVSAGCDEYVGSICIRGSARVWEAATGNEIARMTHEEEWYTRVSAVAFSPDGRWVVSGSEDGTALVWEAATGVEVARMTHERYVRFAVTAIAFSPDGRWVVSGSWDKTARVWEAATGAEVARMTHEESVGSVAFSPDGRWVVSSGGNTARVWEAATGVEVARMTHEVRVYAMAFSPDGRWVVSAGCDKDYIDCIHGSARVWEAETGIEVARMTHEGWVKSVAFSPDGRWVVSGGWDSTARVWAVETGAEVARMTHEGWFKSVAFSPDGRWVVSAGCDEYTHTCIRGSARVWDISVNLNTGTATGAEVTRITHEGGVRSVAFSPDGRWVVSGSWDGIARVWDVSADLSTGAATGTEVTRMTHWRWVDAVAFSPDGRWVVSAGCDEYREYACTRGSARVWEAATGAEVARMTHEGHVDAVAFSPDGRWVVSGSRDKTARVWEAATGAEVARMTHEGFNITVKSVAFSPDGRWVVSSGDNTARVWEAATGAEVARMTHGSFVPAVAFSPDGRWVVSGSWDNTVRVWEAATGVEVARMTHEGYVDAVAFSLDGRWVVSGSDDNTARVWEAATGAEVARMTHEGDVDAVVFSPDGRWVVSGSDDNTARVWWWQPEDLIDLACSRLTRNLTREEWRQYLGDESYRATCPNLPIPDEDASDSQSPVFAPWVSESILRAFLSPTDEGDCDILGRAGNDLYYSNQWREAIAQYELALICYQDTDEYRGQSITLNNIGKIYDGWSRYEEALLHYEQALAIAREIGDQSGEAAILDNIGGVYRAQGKHSKALMYYEQSLSIDRVVENRSEEGRTLNNIGVIYHTQGLYGKALEYFEQALAIHREMDNPICEGATLHNIGAVYLSQGRYGEALEYYGQALAIGQKVRDLTGEGATLNSIGVVYHTQGQYAEALIYYAQALAIRREVEDQIGEATTLHNIGEAYYAQRQYENALAYYTDVLTIWQETERQIEAATTLNSIGVLYDAEGKYEEALTIFEQALTISREIDNKATQGVILDNVGRVYNSSGNHMEALTHYEQAMTVFESLRATAGSEAGRASFIAQHISLYDRVVNLYHAQGQDADVFYTTERGRARAFLDALATGYVQLSDTAADIYTHEMEAYAARQAAQQALIQARVQWPDDATLLADLEAQLAQAEVDYETALAAITAHGDQLATLVPGRSGVLELSQVQALLGDETALVAYWILQEENRVLAFVITRDTLHTVAVDIPYDDLVAAINDFHNFASLEDTHPESLVQLYGWLIAPLREHLTTPHLAIIPHNVLHYLPFAALTDGERFLAEDYVITYLPSAGALPFIQENAEPVGGSPLILGNPTTGEYDATASFATERDGLGPLPFAEREVQAIAALYGVPAFVGEEATEGLLRQMAGESGILHLAAHGKYNPVAPLSSLIALSPDGDHDGWLTVGEIYGLDLQQANLVVLSACETQLGDLSRGDELVGMTRAFIYAGTPTVVASLWNVEDQATAQLMERFYTHLRAGMGKAAALRQAQLDIQAEYPHPYYWAAFVLSGDGGEVQADAVGGRFIPDARTLRWIWLGGGTALCASLGCFGGVGLLLIVVWAMRKGKRRG